MNSKTLDIAIMSVNEDENYLSYWPVVKFAWINLIKVKPVLIVVSDREDHTDYGDHHIFHIKRSNKLSEVMQSQLARIWGVNLFPNEKVIWSDIDMVPLDYNFFHKETEHDDILVYSGGEDDPNNVMMCYFAGNGRNMAKVFKSDTTWENFLSIVEKNTIHKGWFIDQEYVSNCINEVINLKDIRNVFTNDSNLSLNFKNFFKIKKYLNSKTIKRAFDMKNINIVKFNRGWRSITVPLNQIDQSYMPDLDTLGKEQMDEIYDMHLKSGNMPSYHHWKDYIDEIVIKKMKYSPPWGIKNDR